MKTKGGDTDIQGVRVEKAPMLKKSRDGRAGRRGFESGDRDEEAGFPVAKSRSKLVDDDLAVGVVVLQSEASSLTIQVYSTSVESSVSSSASAIAFRRVRQCLRPSSAPPNAHGRPISTPDHLELHRRLPGEAWSSFTRALPSPTLAARPLRLLASWHSERRTNRAKQSYMRSLQQLDLPPCATANLASRASH